MHHKLIRFILKVKKSSCVWNRFQSKITFLIFFRRQRIKYSPLLKVTFPHWASVDTNNLKIRVDEAKISYFNWIKVTERNYSKYLEQRQKINLLLLKLNRGVTVDYGYFIYLKPLVFMGLIINEELHDELMMND